MAEKKSLIEEQHFLSNQLSTQVRTVSISLIAIAWLFLGGAGGIPPFAAKFNQTLLLIAGGSCFLALVLDYFQYVAGYMDVKRILDEGEREGKADLTYNYQALAYRFRIGLFFAKQAALIVGVIAFFFATLRALGA